MPDRTIVARGARLHVRIEGEGPAFVWGHGLLGSMAQEDAGGLFGWPGATRVATVVRYDARGHGRSSRAGPDDHGWPSLAADMLAVADEVAPGRSVALGGASMGCATALHAAHAAPSRVGALVLAIPPTAWASRRAQGRRYAATARFVELAGSAPLSLMGRFVPRPPALRGPMARVHRATMEHLARVDRRAAAAALRGASRSDLPAPEELARLDVPALILAWSGDPSHPLSTAKTLAAVLPQAELHVASRPADVEAWPGLVDDLLTAVAP